MKREREQQLGIEGYIALCGVYGCGWKSKIVLKEEWANYTLTQHLVGMHVDYSQRFGWVIPMSKDQISNGVSSVK